LKILVVKVRHLLQLSGLQSQAKKFSAADFAPPCNFRGAGSAKKRPGEALPGNHRGGQDGHDFPRPEQVRQITKKK
jgi:hypothetical protein